MTENAARSEIQAPAAALVLAYAAAALLNALLTIAKETIDPLRDAMAALAGHHWPVHVGIVTAVFFIGTIALSRGRLARRLVKTNAAAVRLLVGSTLLAAALIAGFYVWID